MDSAIRSLATPHTPHKGNGNFLWRFDILCYVTLARIRAADPSMTTFQTSIPYHSQQASTSYPIGRPSFADPYVTTTRTSDRYSWQDPTGQPIRSYKPRPPMTPTGLTSRHDKRCVGHYPYDGCPNDVDVARPSSGSSGEQKCMVFWPYPTDSFSDMVVSRCTIEGVLV
ncbi:hypothetical protein Tco_0436189 [Tanacetum coccineum]